MVRTKQIGPKYYPKMKEFSDGSWSLYDIVAYYTFGSGQTVVHLATVNEQCVPERVQKSYFENGRQGNPFQKFPSVSTLSSPTKTFRWLMDSKLIDGKIGVHMNQEELMKENLSTENRFLNSKKYKLWHVGICKKIKLIKADLSSFKDESIRTESVTLIKNTIHYIQRKYNWNAADLKDIVDESAREFLIQDVIDN